MRVDDMIFISVDDHVVEPPDMFEGRLPAQVRRCRTARRAHRERQRRLDVQRRRDPEHRLERGGRSSEGRVRRRPDRVRRDARRLLRRARARQGHERGRRARDDELPLVPVVLGPPVHGRRRQGPRAGDGAGLQRLAHRRVVRLVSRPVHPDGTTSAVGPGPVRDRDPAGRSDGLPLDDVHREPGDARPARASTTSIGTRCGRRSRTKGRS